MGPSFRFLPMLLLAVALPAHGAPPGSTKRTHASRANLTPLTKAQRRAFFGLNSERCKLGDATGNEANSPQLAYLLGRAQRQQPPSAPLGYVGVGAEQNYSLMAAASAEFAWLYDRAPVVRDTHLIHGANFRSLTGRTPRERLRQWIAFCEPHNLSRSVRRLERALGDLSQRRRAKVIAQFENYQASYRYRINKLIDLGKRNGAIAPYFVTDTKLFEHVRKMFVAGRVHLSVADHAEDPLFERIADSARRLGVRVDTIYLSNALQSEVDPDFQTRG